MGRGYLSVDTDITATDFLQYMYLTLDAHCCHMGTAIKHPMSDGVKPSFVIFDIRAL